MIGVIANVTPAISNHIGCVKAEPIARAARSVELALPATRVSVVPHEAALAANNHAIHIGNRKR